MNSWNRLLSEAEAWEKSGEPVETARGLAITSEINNHCRTFEELRELLINVFTTGWIRLNGPEDSKKQVDTTEPRIVES